MGRVSGHCAAKEVGQGSAGRGLQSISRCCDFAMIPAFYVALHSHFFLNSRHRSQGTLLAKHQKGSFDYFRLSFVCSSGNMLQPGVSNGKFQLKHEKYLQKIPNMKHEKYLTVKAEGRHHSELPQRRRRTDLLTVLDGAGRWERSSILAPFQPSFSLSAAHVSSISAHLSPCWPISAHFSPVV